MKAKKFKVDQWAYYCQFPESSNNILKKERQRVVVLEVLNRRAMYDYRIYIDGVGTIRKVKEENLFSIIQKSEK